MPRADPGLVLPALVLLCLLIGARGAIEASGVGWFRQTSPPDAVSDAAVPLHVTLGGGEQPAVTLLGWEVLPGSMARLGGELRVRLYWQAEARMSQSLHSFVHLVTPALRRSWAVAQNDNPGRVPTRRWSPALYVVDDLTLRVPLELPPANYTLAAGLVDAGGQRLQAPGNEDGLVSLQELELAPLRAGRRQALHPAVAAPGVFGEGLRLQGYDFQQNAGSAELRLYWQVLPTSSANAARPDLATFVHLLDAGNNLVTQYDGPPLAGLRPTSQWPADALIIDARVLPWPAGLPAGSYRILVGMFDPENMARARVAPEDGAGASHFDAENALVIPCELG